VVSRGTCDHALAREATYHIAQKERFLRVLNQAMKPSGQLVFTEFVRDRAAGDRPELEVWAAMQRYKPALWTAAQYTDCFKSLGFDLRIASDHTAEYRRMTLLAWKDFLEGGELKQLRSSQAAPVIDEVERSLRTVAALEGGALKFYYFVALGGRRRAAVS
jgi:SAM-dependent methyltransferase